VASYWQGGCKGRESYDSTGRIFIAVAGGLRAVVLNGAPASNSVAILWNGVTFQNSDYRPTSDENGLTPRNSPLWAHHDATANPRYTGQISGGIGPGPQRRITGRESILVARCSVV